MIVNQDSKYKFFLVCPYFETDAMVINFPCSAWCVSFLDRDSAEKQLLNLKLNQPDMEWIILESIATTEKHEDKEHYRVFDTVSF